MKMRSVLVVAISAALVGSTTSAAGAQHRYHDVDPNHPHYEAIERVSEAGVAQGDGEGYFHPDRDVTRAQTATLVATAAHMETSDDPPFDDVPPDHPHAHGIAAAAEWEIVSGYEDGTYRPERAINRGQMATLLADAYRLEAEHGPPFDDVDREHPHAEGIAALAEHDVAKGFDDNTYRPDEPVTRAQMAAFLVRADPQL